MSIPRVSYNRQLFSEDLAERGWNAKDLARQAGVSAMSVSRFLRGQHVTARTVAALARGLSQPVSRYLKRRAS